MDNLPIIVSKTKRRISSRKIGSPPVQRVIKQDTESVEYRCVKKDCIFQGLAKKEGGSVKSWKLRWFVLLPRHLLYFIPYEEGPPDANALPLGVINISSIKNPEEIIEIHSKPSKKDTSRFKYCLEMPIRGQRLFHIKVQSIDICREWIKLLRIQVYRLLENPIALDEKGIKSEDFIAKKYEWFENFDKYVESLMNPLTISNYSSPDIKFLNLEKKEKNKVKASKRNTRRSSVVVRNSTEKLLSLDFDQLFNIIETISEKDELCGRILAIKEKMDVSSPLRSGFSLLEQKLQLPFFILDRKLHLQQQQQQQIVTGSNPNVDIGLAKPLKNLIEEISGFYQNSVPKDTPLREAFDNLIEYYKSEIEKLNVYGTKLLKPPVLIEGSDKFMSRRLLYSQAARGILREGRDNKYGLHAVIAYSSMHWKKNPGNPGFEFAIHSLYKLLVGKGTSPSVLLKITKFGNDNTKTSYNVLASKTVHGPLLKNVLEQKPHLISKVDPYYFSASFLIGLLIDVQDGKADNYIVTFNESSRSLEIIGIDNDHAFADSICKFKEGHTINIRNIFYFLPQANYKIAPAIKKIFIELSPLQFVVSWLEQLHRKNLEYESMKASGIFTELDFKEMNLPILLRPGLVLELFWKLTLLCELLKMDQNDNFLTHNDCLRILQPEVYMIVNAIAAKTKGDIPTQGLNSFKYLFKMPVIENDSILKSLLDLPLTDYSSETLNTLIKTSEKPSIHDYVKLRSINISQATTELISNIPFDKLQKNEEYILYDHIIPNIPLTGTITLNRAKGLKPRYLEKLIHMNPNLKNIQLIDSDLQPANFKFLEGKTSPIIFVEDCQFLPEKVVATLQKEGVPIKAKNIHVPVFGRYSMDQLLPYMNRKHLPPEHILKTILFFETKKIDEAIKLLSSNSELVTQYLSLLSTRASANEVLHTAVALDLPDEDIEYLINTLKMDVNEWDLLCCTPLHIAAKLGNLTKCSVLLKNGAKLEHPGQFGRTPLQEAIFYQKGDIANFLLKTHNAREDVPPTTLDGSDTYDLLQLSVARGLVDVVHYLIQERKMEVRSITVPGKKNVLHIAGEANVDNEQLLIYLLEKGANPLAQDAAKNYPLHSAAKGGNFVLSTLLFDHVPDPEAYATAVNKDNLNVLHIAVECVSERVSKNFVSVMLKKFPSLATMKDPLQRTPLIYAVKFGNYEALKVMLDAGVSPVVSDSTGNTPLHFAVELDDKTSAFPILDLLLKHPHQRPEDKIAFLESRNQYGLTPLGRCILLLYRHPELRKEMLNEMQKHGAKIQNCLQESTTKSILHQAIRRGALEPVAFLLENKHSVKVADSQYNTPLHEACTKGHLEIVKLICKTLEQESEIERQTFLNAKNVDGNTATMLAALGPKLHFEIVRELLSCGANPQLENVRGETVMDVAVKRNLQTIVELLRERKV